MVYNETEERLWSAIEFLRQRVKQLEKENLVLAHNWADAEERASLHTLAIAMGVKIEDLGQEHGYKGK